VIADEIRAMYAEGQQPSFKAIDVESWMAALGALIDQNDFPTARFGAKLLLAAHPDIADAEALCRMIDVAPAPDELSPFTHLRGAEVQSVARAGARTVIFVFSGRHYRNGVPFTLLHRWLGRLDASIVYLRDGSRRGFLRGIKSLGAGRKATTSALRAIAAELGAERIVCFGSSTGGFAALLYAVELEAEAAASMSGLTDLSFLSNPPLDQPAWAAIRNLAVILGAAPRPPRVLFVGADGSKRDDRQSKSIANLPSVTVRMLERFDGRLTVPELICRGQFDRVLDWLMTTRPGGAERDIGQFGYFPWREVFA
jgi:hypothetical protein